MVGDAQPCEAVAPVTDEEGSLQTSSRMPELLLRLRADMIYAHCMYHS
jgi:hypothetical protein